MNINIKYYKIICTEPPECLGHERLPTTLSQGSQREQSILTKKDDGNIYTRTLCVTGEAKGAGQPLTPTFQSSTEVYGSKREKCSVLYVITKSTEPVQCTKEVKVPVVMSSRPY